MKVGYPCINRTIKRSTNANFRLSSYSQKKLTETVQKNIDDLWEMLEVNIKHNLLLFRIGSNFVPFASHPICRFDWKKHFEKDLHKLGKFMKQHQFRICMHPDQFILINAKDKKIVKKSIKELEYHCQLLDSLNLDQTAKIQIHVGGVYGDKQSAIDRFVSEYKKLPKLIQKRLVIENDDYRFSLADCLKISKEVAIPIVFDSFHHECLNEGESFFEAMASAAKTWKSKDGLPMVDYSSQHPEKRKGSHIEHINMRHFKKFFQQVKSIDFDLMCEIKDKEQSAQKVAFFLSKNSNFFKN